MMSDMGWSSETARELADLLEDRGVSLRTLADALGHSHNCWHQRLRLGAKTSLSLEDIEVLCAYLKIDPAPLLAGTRRAAEGQP